MKKYIIIGSVAVLVLVAVSVFALQGKNAGNSPSVEAVSPAASASSDCATRCGAIDSADCGSATGGCGAEAASTSKDGQRIDQITAYLVDYYTNKRGLSNVTIEVESFGCHEEATVKQAGRIVEKLSINGNRITKLES